MISADEHGMACYALKQSCCLLVSLVLLRRCSIFSMFDTCLLLGSNGNVVYSGPQRLAQSYMAFLGFYIPPNENLADFLLDVTSGGCDRFHSRSKLPHRFVPSVYHEFCITLDHSALLYLVF